MKAVLAQIESFCVLSNHKNVIKYTHGIIPHLFDCWADPVVHLLLLKSSMAIQLRIVTCRYRISKERCMIVHTFQVSEYFDDRSELIVIFAIDGPSNFALMPTVNFNKTTILLYFAHQKRSIVTRKRDDDSELISRFS